MRNLASRGAQIVLLTQHALSDWFLVEFIDDMRRETGNQLITAEQVNLLSLHSIRAFATKWIDNAPPRRLDLVVLCGNTLTPPRGGIKSTSEGIEVNWQVNYLANFHLLSILSPALRAQPPDRDVRVIFGTCSSYLRGDLSHLDRPTPFKPSSRPHDDKPTDQTSTPRPSTEFSPANAFGTSKLALTTFALSYQKHLSAYARPDKAPMNAKVILVDPGLCRTPGTRRWLTFGSLVGLLLYLLLYPVWWLTLKSPLMGAQSFLYAAMEERFSRGAGGWLIKECAQRPWGRVDVEDEAMQKRLWEYSEGMVQAAEKRAAEARKAEKQAEQEEKETEEAARELREYKEKVGKKEGSRRSRKAG